MDIYSIFVTHIEVNDLFHRITPDIIPLIMLTCIPVCNAIAGKLMPSNFSIALTTLLLTLLIAFLWALVVFASGKSIPLTEVDAHLALRNLFFCLTTFTLLYVTSQLPVRRPIVVKLMVG